MGTDPVAADRRDAGPRRGGLARSSRGARCAALGVLVACGCVDDRALRVRLDAGVEVPARCAVVFFADGLDVGRMDELAAAGRLPHLARRFIAGGVRVRDAIASLPSNTYPNTVSLLTGRFPGDHGIPGNRWFDRHSLASEYYITAKSFRRANQDFRCPTLFEAIPEQLTVAIQLHTRRGARVVIDNELSAGFEWLFGGYLAFDRRSGSSIEQVSDLANRVGRWPALTVLYFPGVDEMGHRFGPRSREYEEALVNFDRQVGRVADALEAAGLLDSTYLALITDHGHVAYDASLYLDVAEWIERNCRLRVREELCHHRAYAERHAHLERYDAIVMNGAFRASAVYVRGRGGWHEPPDPDLLARLAPPADATAGAPEGRWLHEHPGVELVALPESDVCVRIVSRRGAARIERRTTDGVERCRVVVHSGDPLALAGDAEAAAFVDAGFHTSREWLVASAGWRYPDLVPQLADLFHSPRSGDLVLFASDHGTFERHELGGHGSCLASDMRVAMFFAGPDLPPGGSVPCARVVDLAPTVLELLGQSDRIARLGRIDGVSIAEELRRAAAPGAARPAPASPPDGASRAPRRAKGSPPALVRRPRTDRAGTARE